MEVASTAASPPPLGGRLSLAVLIFVLGLRLGYTAAVRGDPANGYPGYSMIQGVPWGDAEAWDQAATELARGWRLEGYWSARRPGYAYLLAGLYVWTGPSFAAAVWANTLASALGAWLAFHVGSRLAGWPLGLVVCLGVAGDPRQLVQSTEIMCEAVGFLLLMLHFLEWFPCSTLGPGRLFRAGLWLGLSTIVRPLVLFAFPGELWLAWRSVRGSGPRSAAWSLAALVGGLAITLAPVMLTQRLRHGIWSISDNSAEHLFGASTTEYGGTWSTEIVRKADQAGITGVRERYEFFRQLAWQNIRREPGVFFTNIGHSLAFNVTGICRVIAQPAWWWGALALVGLLGGRAWLGGWGPGPVTLPRSTRLVTAALAAVAAATLARGLATLGGGWLVVAAAGGWLVWRGPREGWGVVVNALVASWLTLALFVTREERHWSYLEWLAVAVVLAAVARVFRWAVGGSESHAVSAEGAATFAVRPPASLIPPAWRRAGAIIATSFVLLTGLRLAAARWHPWEPEEIRLEFTAGEARKLVDWASQRCPEVLDPLAADKRDFAPERDPAPEGPDELSTADVPATASTVALGSRPTRYVYRLPAGFASPGHGGPFEFRPYRRTVFVAEGSDARGQLWRPLVIWPGELPPEWMERPLGLVGVRRPTTGRVGDLILEGAALVPLEPATGRGQWDEALVAPPGEHRRYLRAASSR